MKKLATIALLLIAAASSAQTISDRPVVLEGATPADRQVKGLADPATESEAMNARSLQAGGYAYAEATGTDDWQVTLAPAPSTITAGMRLMVKVPADNTAAVTITVNGQGPWPVLKNATLALEAGDLAAGETVAIVFDGSAFQLISARRIERRSCPAGFAQVNELYCIEQAQHDTATYYDAALLCGSMGATLCTWGEWYSACNQEAALGLSDMTGDWEWTNSAANADHNVRVVGQTNCAHAGVTDVSVFSRNFRCCYRR
jgi:hypothetical protein